jgi:hypothetical protein
VDSSAQQQFNQWSDVHENGAKMTTIAIYLDGFGHNLATRSLKVIRRQVQRRQRPIVGEDIRDVSLGYQ